MDSGLARGARPGMPACGASPSLPLYDPVPITGKLHAAERAALIKLAHRIGFQLGLFGKGVLAKILGAAGRTVAEIVGAVVVPPAALVVRGAVENLEMDVGMVEPDPAQLHEVFRLQPDREPAVIQRLIAEIADAQTRHANAVL